MPSEHPGDCGPSKPGITAIYYSEHEVAAAALVPSEHPGDCGPSKPVITVTYYSEHEVAAAELVPTEHLKIVVQASQVLPPSIILSMRLLQLS